jgi:hypothetical protein
MVNHHDTHAVVTRPMYLDRSLTEDITNKGYYGIIYSNENSLTVA